MRIIAKQYYITSLAHQKAHADFEDHLKICNALYPNYIILSIMFKLHLKKETLRYNIDFPNIIMRDLLEDPLYKDFFLDPVFWEQLLFFSGEDSSRRNTRDSP